MIKKTIGTVYRTFKKKNIYEIEYKTGEKQTGIFSGKYLIEGEKYFSDGHKEIGKFKEGLFIDGEMCFLNGDKYIGKFKRGNLIKGKKHYSNGIKEIGEFKNNNLIYGEKYFSNKTGVVKKEEGKFKGGHLIDGKKYYWNGIKEEGKFKGGILTDGKIDLPNQGKWVGKFGNNKNCTHISLYGKKTHFFWKNGNPIEIPLENIEGSKCPKIKEKINSSDDKSNTTYIVNDFNKKRYYFAETLIKFNDNIEIYYLEESEFKQKRTLKTNYLIGLYIDKIKYPIINYDIFSHPNANYPEKKMIDKVDFMNRTAHIIPKYSKTILALYELIKTADKNKRGLNVNSDNTNTISIQFNKITALLDEIIDFTKNNTKYVYSKENTLCDLMEEAKISNCVVRHLKNNKII